MIIEFFEKMNPDGSNVAEVYKHFLNLYNPDNITTTETMFLEGFDFTLVKIRNEKKIKILDTFVGKQYGKVERCNIDFLNDYKRNKRFASTLYLFDFKENEFDKVINKIENVKEQYFYIFERINDIEKIEFQNDFIDRLTKLYQKQIFSKYKVVIQNLINKINQPQQTENTNKVVSNLVVENNRNKDYKETIWFKTGIPLATGEAFDLYHKYKLDKGFFTKICLELGFKNSDRTYFSTTINGTDKDSDKNTFANKDKLQKLHKHLTENNLKFGNEFLEKYNQIEPQ